MLIGLNFLNIFSDWLLFRNNDEKMNLNTDNSDYSDFESETSCDSETISDKLHKNIRFL